MSKSDAIDAMGMHIVNNDKVDQYMQHVLLNLYERICTSGSDITINEMITQANFEVQQMMDVQRSFNIEAKYLSQGIKYLYDKEIKNE